MITLDDATAAEDGAQTRVWSEQEEVAAILNPRARRPACRAQISQRQECRSCCRRRRTLWGDYQHYPWSIGFQPSYQAETAVYAKYVLTNKPDARIALFYQNDDAGKDYGNGFKKGLGPENTAKMVVAETTYESTDPTVDSQIVKWASGANAVHARDPQGRRDQEDRRSAEARHVLPRGDLDLVSRC